MRPYGGPRVVKLLPWYYVPNASCTTAAGRRRARDDVAEGVEDDAELQREARERYIDECYSYHPDECHCWSTGAHTRLICEECGRRMVERFLYCDVLPLKVPVKEAA